MAASRISGFAQGLIGLRPEMGAHPVDMGLRRAMELGEQRLPLGRQCQAHRAAVGGRGGAGDEAALLHPPDLRHEIGLLDAEALGHLALAGPRISGDDRQNGIVRRRDAMGCKTGHDVGENGELGPPQQVADMAVEWSEIQPHAAPQDCPGRSAAPPCPFCLDASGAH